MVTALPRRIRGQAVALGLQLAGVATAAALLLVLATRHNVRIDLTPDRAHTLTPATREVLQRLDRDVRITVFYNGREPARRREMADLASRYAAASSRVAVRLLDLDRSPGAAKRLGVTRYDTGVLEADQRLPLGIIDEEEITSALMAIVEPGERVLYFTTAHGEHDPSDAHERRGYSDLARTLEAERYAIRELDGLGAHPIPTDAAAIVVAGPRTDFDGAALDALRRYVQGGGAVVFLLDPTTPPGLAAFLREYGLVVGNDVIVDERNALLGTDSFMPKIPYLNRSAFRDPPELPAVLAEAQSIAIVDERTEVAATYLASSAESTWADADRDSLAADTPRFVQGQDHRGPVPVAALARLNDAPRGGVVVVGDADFVNNLYLGLLGNREFFLSTIGLLTRRELHGALRPTRPGGALSPLSLTARQTLAVFAATVAAPPALLLLVGLIAALWRRRSPA
jgi:ABC-type uncharacterized transport system involved in gliding motility auxiliary subunit